MALKGEFGRRKKHLSVQFVREGVHGPRLGSAHLNTGFSGYIIPQQSPLLQYTVSAWLDTCWAGLLGGSGAKYTLADSGYCSKIPLSHLQRIHPTPHPPLPRASSATPNRWCMTSLPSQVVEIMTWHGLIFPPLKNDKRWTLSRRGVVQTIDVVILITCYKQMSRHVFKLWQVSAPSCHGLSIQM